MTDPHKVPNCDNEGVPCPHARLMPFPSKMALYLTIAYANFEVDGHVCLDCRGLLLSIPDGVPILDELAAAHAREGRQCENDETAASTQEKK